VFSLDANVLFYAADKTAGIQHAAARRIVLEAEGPNAGISEQVLFEFYHSTTRKRRIPAVEAATIIRDLAQKLTLMVAPPTIVDDTLRLLAAYRLSVWDARILAVCGAYECHTLLSEDMQDGGIYNGVRVVNPFIHKNATIVGALLMS
jgi:predicted nucleic acid-binding protein